MAQHDQSTTLQSNQRALGLFLTGLSGLCFAFASLFVKLTGHEVPVSLIILPRSLLQLLTALALNAIIWRQPLLAPSTPPPADNPCSRYLNTAVLVVFGVLGFLVIFGIYISFQSIPLGEATVILSTCPLFVAFFERVWLRTRIPISTLAAGMVCIVGVLLLTHSRTEKQETRHLTGYFLITIATALQAITFVLVRYLGVHFVVPVFYLGLTNSLLAGAACVPLLLRPDPLIPGMSLTQGIWLLLVSFFAVAGSFLLNIGLQHGQATLVSLVRNVDIVAAYTFDTLIFDHTFSALSVIGGLLVVLATVGSGLVDLLMIEDRESDRYCKLDMEQSTRALVTSENDENG